MNMAANDLIDRLERETGCRIDDNEGNNAAMDGIMGTMSRLMGKSPSTYTEHDDVAAGMYLRMTSTEEYKQRKAADEAMISLFLASLK